MDEDKLQRCLPQPGSSEWIPEKHLMLAVLEDAVRVFQKHCLSPMGSRGRKDFEEDERWIASNSTRRPLSFKNICDALDLNPAYIRDGLEKWRSGYVDETIEHARTQQSRRH